jgi:hypothetical protein
MLWVAPIGDRRSYAILARNFLVENSTNKKLTKFPEYLSQVVDTRRSGANDTNAHCPLLYSLTVIFLVG